MKTNTAKSEAKFNALRAKFLKIEAERDEFRAELARKYGSGFQRHWLTTVEEKKLGKLSARADMVETDFFELLDTISPRSWRSYVACSWVMHELTFADATTAGQLTATPQMAYGATQYDIARLMAPVAKPE